ncbi:MAG TPA: VCBS repeat-containing protein [Spirillospora sp.]|nr:VCBS repeat-containing protein [Spirillospora sp.]
MTLKFRRETIWRGTPEERTLCVVGDVSGNGVSDIVIASRNPRPVLYWLGRNADGVWEQHIMDESDTLDRLEAGGALADINGDGRLDFVGGSDARGNGIFWWENPGDPNQPWKRTEIYRMPDNQSHDQLVADLDGDGRLEVYFWNQKTTTLFYAPVPDNPYVSPWPDVYPIMTGTREEGFAVADVDGDGRPELIAGTSWYRPPTRPGGEWERHIFVKDFVSPRVAAADLDGDGRVEIVLAEGDASYLTDRYYGRVARCWHDGDPTKLWQVEFLHEKLADPHSVVPADFDGDGRIELFVGELGDPNAKDRHTPKQRVYRNFGGQVEEIIIDEGLGTHESKAIEIDGKFGVICKPYRNVRDDIPRTPDVDSIHIWLPE